MDKIVIPASITLEKSVATQRYKWKSNKRKESVYKRPYKRAFIRFTCRKFAKEINKTEKENRQISIIFLNESNISIKRIKNKGISLQGYSGNHPYIQFIINKILPKSIWSIFEKSGKKTLTIPINLEINLDDWRDLNISPENFILEIEKEAKILMRKALKKRFKIGLISKGRNYDLGLITPSKKEVIIGISSHIAKNKSRSKEKTIQKILMDISKMLLYLDSHKKTIPVIITRPINFENSWSYTSNKYLEFYEQKFGFIFLTTEFKNNWEDNIIRELLKI